MDQVRRFLECIVASMASPLSYDGSADEDDEDEDDDDNDDGGGGGGAIGVLNFLSDTDDNRLACIP